MVLLHSLQSFGRQRWSLNLSFAYLSSRKFFWTDSNAVNLQRFWPVIGWLLLSLMRYANDYSSLLYFLVYVCQHLRGCYGVLSICHLQNLHRTNGINYCLGSVSLLHRPLHAVGLCLPLCYISKTNWQLVYCFTILALQPSSTQHERALCKARVWACALLIGDWACKPPNQRGFIENARRRVKDGVLYLYNPA